MQRLIAAGQWKDGDPRILIVADAGYDATRLTFLLSDLPVELLGRLRSDRVMCLPTPPRTYNFEGGRPPKHGAADGHDPETKALDLLRARLTTAYSQHPPAAVNAAADRVLQAFADAPVRDFVALLSERRARGEPDIELDGRNTQ